jgi:hypothetical protein
LSTFPRNIWGNHEYRDCRAFYNLSRKNSEF